MKKKYTGILLMLILLIFTGSCLPAFAENDRPPVTDPNKWAGKKIACLTGSVFINLVQENYPGAECVYFDTISDCILSVQKGKTDATIVDLPVMKYCIALNPSMEGEMARDEIIPIGIVASKSEKGQKLIAEFNNWLATYRSSGKLDATTRKWTDEYKETADIEDYSNLPAIKGTILIATDPTMAPMEFVKNEKIVGMDMEMMRDFCKDCGYEMNVINVNFQGALSGVSSGKYDIGVNCIGMTEERKKSVTFSDIYYESGPAILYMTDSSGSAGFFENLKSSFTKTFITEDRWKLFVGGILVTLQITCLSILFGTILGFVIHFFCRKGNKIANGISRFCRWLIQGMPIVVFLMILFYIVFGKSSIGSVWVAVVAFTLLFTCSVHNLLENGEKAVDSGQDLAATALGYSPSQKYFMIILPQAAKHFLPVYLGEIDALLKATAIVGYIAVVDLSKSGDLVRSITYDAFFPLISVAILYFILSGILKTIVKSLTKKADPTLRSEEDILKGVVIK